MNGILNINALIFGSGKNVLDKQDESIKALEGFIQKLDDKIHSNHPISMLPKDYGQIDGINIPSEWEFFPNSDSFMWKGIDFPVAANSSGCVFHVIKDCDLRYHRHENREILMIDSGYCKICTADDQEGRNETCYDIGPEGSIELNPGQWHNCVFKSGTAGIIIWKPRFVNGWKADIIKDE